ncbi:MAG: polyamine aminopropyltransferase, partial [Rubripirellula sp.]|nr:polyamine aminopropyltransferase [Rubripirellula sp.]
HLDFSDLVSRVLTFDYIGALIASLLFPLLLVPYLGLVRTSLVFGILNALVGIWGTYLLRPLLSARGVSGMRGRGVVVIGILVVALIKADSLTMWAEEAMLGNPIVYSKQTRFQRIVVTQNPLGFQLHLNGHLQFNSADEYRYHEALVHPAMSAVENPRRILVLGGGDGLAVREILKYPSVETVTLVDIDPGMTELARGLKPLRDLNEQSLLQEKVTVENRDAFAWVGEQHEPFDAVIIDFPDPGSYSVGKLYTTFFFRMLRNSLTADAVVSIQCTSPLVAPKSYWCILGSMEAAGFSVLPYHVPVPTFGIWGFALAGTDANNLRPAEIAEINGELRFLNNPMLDNMFDLPVDIQQVETELNQLNNQILVRYYESEWGGRE